jgi:Fic-DOC domain mobile mystery protein B
MAKNDLVGTEDGNTPLDEDAIDGLLPSDVHTREELNAWEATNISHAIAWAYGRAHVDILRVETLMELHRRMFDATWSWAGTFRRSENPISPYPWTQVPVMIRELVEDVLAQRATGGDAVAALDDTALRFHHRIVRIHPWPNGNGRHARLATDLLLRAWNRPAFTWGDNSAAGLNEAARPVYITALRAADAGDFRQLRKFVHS